MNMISSIRQNFKNKTTQILVLITCLAPLIALLSMFLFGPRGRGLTSGPWVATVNGNSINTRSFVNKVGQIENYIRALRQEYKDAADFFIKHMGLEQDPKQMALDLLIQEGLIAQVASSLNLNLHNQYVEKNIAKQVPPAVIKEDGSIDMLLLRSFLKRSGMTLATFEELVEKELERQLTLTLLGSSSYLPEFIIRNQFKQKYAGKKFAVISLPLATVLKEVKKTPVTGDEVQAFFKEQNRARRYWQAEKRAGVAWHFNASDYNAQVTDKEIKTYYEKHKTKNFVETPVQVQVRRILLKTSETRDHQATHELAQDLKKQLTSDQKQFDALARKYSDDTATASNGGLMPFFGKGTHNLLFDRTALLLQSDGAISEVIETDDGIEILQRVARKELSFKSFDSVKNEIKESLLKGKFTDSFAREIKPLLGNKEKLATFAKKHDGRMKEIQLQEGSDDQLIASLFSASASEANFFFDDNQATVVSLTDRQESRAAEFSEVRDQVFTDLYVKKAQDELSRRLKSAKEGILFMKDATLLDRMKAQQKKISESTFVETGWIRPGDKESIEKVQSEGLPLMPMLQLEKTSRDGSEIESYQDADGGHLFVLLEREGINEAEFADKQDELHTQLTRQFAQSTQNGFIANLRKDATIKVNSSIFAANSNYPR